MLTLAGCGREEVEIKRSRFVANASRVDDAGEAQAFYERVADPAATHNCWAWKLGQQYRFNDDGEPASTAGRPILAAIEGFGLENAMVVVTRYFGGIKLGAGGLARAYGTAASRCLEAAGFERINPTLECAIDAGFEWTGPIYAALESCHGEKLDERFSASGISLRARVEESVFAELCATVRDATRGAARIRRLGPANRAP